MGNALRRCFGKRNGEAGAALLIEKLNERKTELQRELNLVQSRMEAVSKGHVALVGRYKEVNRGLPEGVIGRIKQEFSKADAEVKKVERSIKVTEAQVARLQSLREMRSHAANTRELQKVLVDLARDLDIDINDKTVAARFEKATAAIGRGADAMVEMDDGLREFDDEIEKASGTVSSSVADRDALLEDGADDYFRSLMAGDAAVERVVSKPRVPVETTASDTTSLLRAPSFHARSDEDERSLLELASL